MGRNTAYSALHLEVRGMLLGSFPGLLFEENTYPKWIIEIVGRRLQLDFYIPSLRLAVEVQGAQHDSFIRYFHEDLNGYLDQERRDTFKKYACKLEGIRLVEIRKSVHITSLKGVIKKMLPPVPKTPKLHTKHLRMLKKHEELKYALEQFEIKREQREHRRERRAKRRPSQRDYGLIYDGETIYVSAGTFHDAVKLCRADQVGQRSAIVREWRYSLKKTFTSSYGITYVRFFAKYDAQETLAEAEKEPPDQEDY